MVDLKRLKYFVTVAEELHYRRAAAKLGVSQPPLSMAIRSLEEELGVALFERTRRSVVLTAAGNRLLIDARRILGSVAEAVVAARRTAEGEEGRLQIGLTPSAAFNLVVPSILRSYRLADPIVDFSLSENNTLSLIAALRSGEIDGAFLRPTDVKTGELVLITILQEPMLAAVPANHRFASTETIALSDLKAETIILRPRPIGERLTNLLISVCEEAGFSPMISQIDAPQMTSILSFVAAELGITFVPASMSRFFEGFVVYKEISDPGMPKAILSFARHASSPSPTLLHFEEIIQSHVQNISSSSGLIP